jgi:serine/threonine protein kinase
MLADINHGTLLCRDMKPENVLYRSPAADAEPVIADFGLSKDMDVHEAGTSLVGTPGYVSPEIIRDRVYGPEADVWALGVITYILLCGYPPFYAENNKDLYAQVGGGHACGRWRCCVWSATGSYTRLQ